MTNCPLRSHGIEKDKCAYFKENRKLENQNQNSVEFTQLDASEFINIEEIEALFTFSEGKGSAAMLKAAADGSYLSVEQQRDLHLEHAHLSSYPSTSAKILKMMDDNKQLAQRIDGAIQSASQEVTNLRSELSATSRRLTELGATDSSASMLETLQHNHNAVSWYSELSDRICSIPALAALSFETTYIRDTSEIKHGKKGLAVVNRSYHPAYNCPSISMQTVQPAGACCVGEADWANLDVTVVAGGPRHQCS
ncbi:hypothetical protein PAMP_011854 [Pampus punctatissimus]